MRTAFFPVVNCFPVEDDELLYLLLSIGTRVGRFHTDQRAHLLCVPFDRSLFQVFPLFTLTSEFFPYILCRTFPRVPDLYVVLFMLFQLLVFFLFNLSCNLTFEFPINYQAMESFFRSDPVPDTLSVYSNRSPFFFPPRLQSRPPPFCRSPPCIGTSLSFFSVPGFFPFSVRLKPRTFSLNHFKFQNFALVRILTELLSTDLSKFPPTTLSMSRAVYGWLLRGIYDKKRSPVK